MNHGQSAAEPPSALAYRAYAKVNLTLELLGQRSDGYHEIASLVRTIRLADELRFDLADGITCTVEGLELAADENLVLRAARLLAETTAVERGVRVALRKRVPVAGGLGGGSSDAAATLLALNRLWRTHLHRRGLAALAARLGSDVPFFLRGGAAVMRGRGERLQPVARARPAWLVLVAPRHDISHKTARLYAALRPADFTDGRATEAAAARLATEGSVEDADLVNGFARTARAVFPGLARLWEAAEGCARRPLHLAGAGPTLFALATSDADARAVAHGLRGLGQPVYVTRTVGKGQRGRRISDS